MSWIGGNWSNLTGQLANYTKDLLDETVEENQDVQTESHMMKQDISRLQKECELKERDLQTLATERQDLEEKVKTLELQVASTGEYYQRIIKTKEEEVRKIKKDKDELFQLQQVAHGPLSPELPSGPGAVFHKPEDSSKLSSELRNTKAALRKAELELEHWQEIANSNAKSDNDKVDRINNAEQEVALDKLRDDLKQSNETILELKLENEKLRHSRDQGLDEQQDALNALRQNFEGRLTLLQDEFDRYVEDTDAKLQAHENEPTAERVSTILDNKPGTEESSCQTVDFLSDACEKELDQRFSGVDETSAVDDVAIHSVDSYREHVRDLILTVLDSESDVYDDENNLFSDLESQDLEQLFNTLRLVIERKIFARSAVTDADVARRQIEFERNLSARLNRLLTTTVQTGDDDVADVPNDPEASSSPFDLDQILTNLASHIEVSSGAKSQIPVTPADVSADLQSRCETAEQAVSLLNENLSEVTQEKERLLEANQTLEDAGLCFQEDLQEKQCLLDIANKKVRYLAELVSETELSVLHTITAENDIVDDGDTKRLSLPAAFHEETPESSHRPHHSRHVEPARLLRKIEDILQRLVDEDDSQGRIDGVLRELRSLKVWLATNKLTFGKLPTNIEVIHCEDSSPHGGKVTETDDCGAQTENLMEYTDIGVNTEFEDTQKECATVCPNCETFQSRIALLEQRDTDFGKSLQAKHDECVRYYELSQTLTERETKLANELERLRTHLVEMENEFTQAALRAETTEDQLRTQLATVTNDLENARGDGVADEEKIELQKQIGALSTQLTVVSQARDAVVMETHTVKDELARAKREATTLKETIAGLEQEQISLIRDETHRWKKRNDEHAVIVNQLKDDLEKVKAELLQKTATLEQSQKESANLDTLRSTITKLRKELEHQVGLSRDAASQLSALNESRKDMIDKCVMRSLLLAYMSAPEERRPEALEMVASIVGLSQKELGEARTKAGPAWLGTSPRKQTTPPVDQGGSLSQLFVKFLETEVETATEKSQNVAAVGQLSLLPPQAQASPSPRTSPAEPKKS